MAKNICPQCKNKGEKIEFDIVDRYACMGFDGTSGEFFVCLDPVCDTVYFNNHSREILKTTDLEYKREKMTGCEDCSQCKD